MLSKEAHFRFKDTNKLKVKAQEKVYIHIVIKRIREAARTKIRQKTLKKITTRDKEHLITIKDLIYQESITIINTYASNNRALKYEAIKDRIKRKKQIVLQYLEVANLCRQKVDKWSQGLVGEQLTAHKYTASLQGDENALEIRQW